MPAAPHAEIYVYDASASGVLITNRPREQWVPSSVHPEGGKSLPADARVTVAPLPARARASSTAPAAVSQGMAVSVVQSAGNEEARETETLAQRVRRRED